MPRYLLDTHALIHWQTRERIPVRMVTTLDSAALSGNVVVATVSFWEIAFLVKKGRLVIDDLVDWEAEVISSSGIRVVDPTSVEMIESTRLPDHHGDPFDRLLVAIARRRGLVLVTADEMIQRYEVDTIWEV
jgi:PIN domain nuclease of toxin-antitoxin system